MSAYTADELAAARLVADYWLRHADPANMPQAAAWLPIAQAAVRQSIGPLLFVAVQKWRQQHVIPSEVVDLLRGSYMRVLRSNTLRFAAAGEILAAFQKAGIDAILLKGCALAPTLYGDLALRVISDIDLLVDISQRDAASEVLEQLGYELRYDMHDGDFADEQMGEKSYLRRGAQRSFVDLHWRLLNIPGYSRQLATDRFFANARSVTVANQPSKVLGPELQLLHCSLHYYLHHQGEGLKWTFDVALLLAREAGTINWPALAAFCKETSTATPVTIMIEHVADIWQVVSPPAAIAAGFAPNRKQLRWQIALTLLRSPLRHPFLSLRSGQLRNGLAYARKVFFPPSEYLQQRYGAAPGASMLPFYALRLGRGMRQLVSYLFRGTTSR